MVEETDPGRDVDGLDRRGGAWLAVEVDKHFDLCLIGFASNRSGASARHRVVSLCVGRAVQLVSLRDRRSAIRVVICHICRIHSPLIEMGAEVLKCTAYCKPCVYVLYSSPMYCIDTN